MLLIDGAKYELWTPSTEDELEQIVKEHAQDIFGEQSIYFDRKQKLKSLSGIGSIPDGYVISFQGVPCWCICEVELHTHPLYEHIVPQMTKFINGVKSLSSQREVINAFYGELNSDRFNEALVRSKIGSAEVYHFISDLISKPPILVIVINQKTKELQEVCDSLPIEVKIVEFQTFTREGIGLPVHAHLFEPVFQAPTKLITRTEPTGEVTKVTGRVTAKDLLDAGILQVDQVIYGWYPKNTKHEGKVLNNGSIELIHTGEKFPSLNAAVSHITGTAWDAWYWWYATREDGTECLLNELREEYRSKISS